MTFLIPTEALPPFQCCFNAPGKVEMQNFRTPPMRATAPPPPDQKEVETP